MLELTREEKSHILRNEKDYPELSRIIKYQNKYRFENENTKRSKYLIKMLIASLCFID